MKTEMNIKYLKECYLGAVFKTTGDDSKITREDSKTTKGTFNPMVETLRTFRIMDLKGMFKMDLKGTSRITSKETSRNKDKAIFRKTQPNLWVMV